LDQLTHDETMAISVDDPRVVARANGVRAAGHRALDKAIANLKEALDSSNIGQRRNAVAEALAIERLLEQLGDDIDSDKRTMLEKLIRDVRDQAHKDLLADCASGTNRAVAAAHDVLAIERGTAFNGEGPSATEDAFRKCLDVLLGVDVKLDVVYDRNWINTTGWHNYTFTAKGTAVLDYKATNGFPSWSADIPLAIDPFTTNDPKCSGIGAGRLPAMVRVTVSPNINPTRNPKATPYLIVNLLPQGQLVMQCPGAVNFSLNLSEGDQIYIKELHAVPYNGGTVKFAGTAAVTNVQSWKLNAEVIVQRLSG
jgi:hypothetical protein